MACTDPQPGPRSRPHPRARTWTLVLPVKGGPGAKSRLRMRGGPAGGDLAAAIAADTLHAVRACPAVGRLLVVTADAAASAAAVRSGAVVVAERRPGAGLSAAVADGLAAATRLPCAGPVGVLLADLPALRATDLDAALAAVSGALTGSTAMVAVPDADGEGTVLLAARRAADLRPAFGPDSLAEHRRRGAVVLALDLPRLRRDVDTPADLAAALALGCGPGTTAAAEGLGVGAATDYAGAVQATIHRFDPTSGNGSVITDEGVVVPFTAEAFAHSRLLQLRTGQRVKVTMSGTEQEPVVTEMHVHGVGFVPADPARP